MWTSVFSTLHIFALVIGLPAVWFRGQALRRGDLVAVFRADNAWGVAALLWWGTGLMRAFGGLEKGTDWYLHNPLFHVKMAVFGVVVLLELWPMVTFIRWRIRTARGQALDLRHLPTFYWINQVELVLTAALPFIASAMARRLW